MYKKCKIHQAEQSPKSRKNSHSCSHKVSCKLASQCPTAQATALLGGDNIIIPANGLIPFNTQDDVAEESSIRLTPHGLFQIAECGRYSINFSVQLDSGSLSTIVQLVTFSSPSGSQQVPCYGCSSGNAHPTSTGGHILLSSTRRIQNATFGGVIEGNYIIDVQSLCLEVGLYNASQDDILSLAQSVPPQPQPFAPWSAFMNITKISSCGSC